MAEVTPFVPSTHSTRAENKEKASVSGATQVDVLDGCTFGDHGRHSATRSLRSRLSKLSADQWFWEVFGITVSVAAIVAICAILAFFGGKATPKLPHGITVRPYLSLESFRWLWCSSLTPLFRFWHFLLGRPY
jgi:hypothetical protein